MTISRRTLLGAGVGIGVGVVSGCGSNTGRGGGSSGGVRLAQWYHQYGEAGTEQAVKRYAAAYTKARVTVQWRPGNYDQQMAAALLTDSGPDVFEVNGPSLDQIQGGQVEDLTALLDGVKSDFNPAVLAPKTYQGKVYGIPQTVDMQMLYYRKSMLRDAGVEPPQTLDELVDAARKLSNSKVKGLFLGNDGGAGVLGGTPLYAAGLQLVTEDGKVGFDDPAAARALGKLRELYAGKALLLGAPTDWSDPSAFLQGLTAMQWSGLWALPQVQKELGDDFGVLPFPGRGAREADRSRRGVRGRRQCAEQAQGGGQGVCEVALGGTGRLPGGFRARVRVPHPRADLAREEGRQAEDRRGRRRRTVRHRARIRPAAAVDPRLPDRLPGRPEPDHQGRREPGE